MSKISQTKTELGKQLKDQLSLLTMLADSYDAGNNLVAKSIATSIRVLVHNTPKSHSLLDQLNLKNRKFFDTSLSVKGYNLPNTIRVSSFCGLVCISTHAGKQFFIPYLDEIPKDTFKFVDFNDYWNRIIFVDNKNNRFSRKEIVLALSNQDGGAHVDPEIDEKYKKLSRENSLGWMGSADGKIWNKLEGPELAAVRQIGHEILRTFLPKYPYKKMVTSGSGLIIGGVGVWLETKSTESKKNVKVGRNEKCPCGSGLKYKKCHGK